MDKDVHPIDRSRIYVSGFSMGSMMSNAMACAHPETIAAAAPCNAYNEGYFSNFVQMQSRKNSPNYDPSANPNDVSDSNIKIEADKKKAEFDYRMPIIQTSGLIDGVWPISCADDARLKTFDYWKKYNNIHTESFVQDVTNESGITADETVYEGDDSRFLHHRWFTCDESHESLYELLLTKRCPHALDIRTTTIAWEFLKKFSRNSDGTLSIIK
jgi:poly(3-hydroxybutyrate) depolymerase